MVKPEAPERGSDYRYPLWRQLWVLGICVTMIVVMADVAISRDSIGSPLSRLVLIALSLGSFCMMVIMALSPWAFLINGGRLTARYYSGGRKEWSLDSLYCDESRADLWGSFRVYDTAGTLQFRFWPGLRGIEEFRAVVCSHRGDDEAEV